MASLSHNEWSKYGISFIFNVPKSCKSWQILRLLIYPNHAFIAQPYLFAILGQHWIIRYPWIWQEINRFIIQCLQWKQVSSTRRHRWNTQQKYIWKNISMSMNEIVAYIQCGSWANFNVRMPSFQDRKLHYKCKMVSYPSHVYNRNLNKQKDGFFCTKYGLK